MKRILLVFLVLTATLTTTHLFSQTSCALNPDFSDPDPTKIVDGGIPGGGYEVGDRFLFENVLPSVNAEVHIEAKQGTFIFGLDNNSGNAERFQPFIASKTANTEGYVQFSILFRRTADNSIIPISQLRLTAFDVDGDISQPGDPSWSISELVDVANPTSVTFNSPTTLTDAGNVVSNGFTWRRVLGQTFQYNDPVGNPSLEAVSNDPAHSFTAMYGPSSAIRFRLGYSTQQDVSGGFNYSIEFGCFVEGENIPLPLTLLNFNGSYSNNKSILNWTTQSEINVDRFEIERSVDGVTYAKVGSAPAKGANGATTNYQLTEDMTNVSGALFYYRLKSIDKDGKFTYSNIISLKTVGRLSNQISVVPNPVINGNGILRITAITNGFANLKIVDLAGRIVRSQRVNLFEGVNVVPLNHGTRLTSGTYLVQLINEKEILTSKFVVGQ